MLKYKGKDVVAPPNNTKYIPVKTYSGAQESNMAITDIQVVGDTPYCKIGDNAYLWREKQALKLTDDYYKMYEVYPDTYDSMTEVPDQLDTSELTTMSGMFVKFAPPDFLEDASPTQEEYEEEVAKTRAIANITIAPEMDCSHITNMSSMFGVDASREFETYPGIPGSPIYTLYASYGCTNLTTVPLYDTHNVSNFQDMFACCTSLPRVFPWVIAVDSIESYGALMSMFAGSSVEEVNFGVFCGTLTNKYDDPDAPIAPWLSDMGITSSNIFGGHRFQDLDYKGVLNKITFSVYAMRDHGELVNVLDDQSVTFTRPQG